MRQVTLCLLIKDDKVLLAMKKRGFGVGRWNGVGGKQAEGENIEQTAIRETQEEIGVTPTDLTPVGTFDFHFPGHPEWEQQMHVFLVTDWQGEPAESEEMQPAWFAKDKLPLESMWASDVFWMPKVLAGEKVSGEFTFGLGDIVLSHKLYGQR